MMIHFIRPFWLLALIPALFYFTWIICSSRQKNPWQKICDPHLLAKLLQENKMKSQRFFYSILLFFFIIAIFALSGPSWQKTQLPVYRDINSTMLVLDLSPAMLTNDLTPERLSRAKFKIRDLITNSQNTQMGLVAFSGEAFVASPLAQDANTLKGIVDELHPQIMPLSGSDIGQGLTEALTLLKQSDVQNSSVLLITCSEPTTNSWTAAKALREAGYQLNILAMLPSNSETKAVISALKELAKIGGGSFNLFTPDATDIENILQSYSGNQTVKDQNVEDAKFWRDAGPWFCLLLIPLVMLILREKTV